MLSQLAPEVTPALFGLMFSQGILAFLSPCILPMLPVYLLYLAGGDGKGGDRRLLRNMLGFILGFTVIFVLMGATASGLGSLLQQHRTLLSRIGGVIVILLGINFTGLVHLPFLNRSHVFNADKSNLNFWKSLLFGIAFSAGWTPCLGAFLGSALLVAANSETLLAGMALLFTFAMGLSVPFLLAALLWNHIQGAIGWIKRHLHIIQIISGSLLVIVGLLMVTGLFDRYLQLFI